MAIVKFEAINKAETELVKKYLAMGLEIDTNAMSGTQGEKGKVALADDKYVYFIYTDHDYSDGDVWNRHDVMKVVVERHDRDRRDLIDTWHTYWLGKGEVVEEIIFHELPSRDSYVKAYTTDEAEFNRVQEKHHERSYSRRDTWNNWKNVRYNVNTIVGVVKAKTGRKRVVEENIVEVEKHCKENNYWRITVMFNGKQSCFSVHQAQA